MLTREEKAETEGNDQRYYTCYDHADGAIDKRVGS